MLKQWWHEAIGYEIYPKSFKDGNHDGIGDLIGIIEKLDYLQELGINLIWICPIYQSPMIDHGYDIANYEEIDEMFGDKEILKKLLEEAKKRDIKVLMDLVVNHTSNQHEWFQKALKDPHGKYGQYYIFRQGTKDIPPNNWSGIFNGSTWERVGGADSDLYYLHIFTTEQPDLNWENPDLRKEIYDMMKRWLDFGIAGFRVDAISHIKKNFDYETQIAERKDGLFFGLDYFNNVDGIDIFLNDMKDEIFSKYDCFTLGEVNTPTIQQLEEYAGEGGYFSSVFDFCHTFLNVAEEEYVENFASFVADWKKKLFYVQTKTKPTTFLANIIENHDLPRGINRFLPEEYHSFYSESLLGTVNFFMKGIPFLYQGQEIGMKNFPKEDIHAFQDPTTLRQFEEKIAFGYSKEEALVFINRTSREHTRTPMQWDSSLYGGFSKREPWFEMNPNKESIHTNENSLLYYYKKMIALRKNKIYQDTWIYGTIEPIFEEIEGIIAYIRKDEKHSLLCLNCMNAKEVTIVFPYSIKKVLLANYEDRIEPEDFWQESNDMNQMENLMPLRAFESVVIEVE